MRLDILSRKFLSRRWRIYWTSEFKQLESTADLDFVIYNQNKETHKTICIIHIDIEFPEWA